MGYALKQSQSTYPLLFRMVDSTDHVTGKTGLSPTVTISKNSGSFASPSGDVTEIGSGWYKVAANATDENTLGPLALKATGTGADECSELFFIVSYDPFDATRLGLTGIPNATAGASGGLPVIGTGSNQFKSDSSANVTVGGFAAATGMSSIRAATAQTGSTSTTIKLDSGASAVDDFYNDQSVTIHTGTGAGQSRVVTDYVGSTKVATIHRAWTTTPDNTSQFVILRETELQGGSGSVSLGTNAPAGWINAAAFGASAIDAAALAADAGSEIASAVRTNLATELGRIDAAISTRLASASYSASLDAAGVRAAIGMASADLDTQLDAIAASSGLDAAGVRAAVGLASANLDTQLGGISSKTTNLPASPASTGDCITAAGVRSAMGLASANLDTQIASLATSTSISALNNLSIANVRTAVGLASANLDTQLAAIAASAGSSSFTAALTESYSTAGATASAAQLLYEIRQGMSEFSISGATKTVKKIDGSTTAATYTLDDDEEPTSITRAT